MTELLIVGGGIMGLWAAVYAARAGLDTVVVEARTLGSGASGGFLGALMPHVPERWNEKKQFQFDSLVTLEAEIARLEAETGLSAGYRRSGRIVPLATAHLRDLALKHQDEAKINWAGGARDFSWTHCPSAPSPGWPDDAAIPFGLSFDTLAARADPRALIACLATCLARSPHVTIMAGASLASIDPAGGTAIFADGRRIAFAHALVCAGVASFPLLDSLGKEGDRPSGQAVKGQAALLDAHIDPSLPIVFSDGLYIVPHESGHVAIGSTSENMFDDPHSTDAGLDILLTRAAAFVPALGCAPVLERWAGLRPKAIGREPMVGLHPDYANVTVLTGGFKVSFGLAHRLAEAAIAGICRADCAIVLPQAFRTEAHFALIRSH